MVRVGIFVKEGRESEAHPQAEGSISIQLSCQGKREEVSTEGELERNAQMHQKSRVQTFSCLKVLTCSELRMDFNQCFKKCGSVLDFQGSKLRKGLPSTLHRFYSKNQFTK